MINIVLSCIGTLLTIFWIFIGLKAGKKYDALVEQVDEKEYFAKWLFPIGFCTIEMFHINMNSKMMNKKVRKLSEMFGAKLAKQIMLTDLAAQISYTLTLAPLGVLLAVMANDISVLLIAVGLILFLIVYLEYDKESKLQSRHEVILREFPHVLSQIALLVNAGMPLRETLEVTAGKNSGVLYKEMQVLVDDMHNGIPEYEAFSNFSDRCGVDSVRKFSSLIIQNVKKGSSELASVLMELSGEIWKNRVSLVREEGEKASAKLMIPIFIIFGGILVLVVVPIIKDMGM